MSTPTNTLLSKQFLTDIGVEVDDETYQALSEHYEATLDDRILRAVVAELDEDQLRAVVSMQDQPERLSAWLVVNIPDLGDIIEDEVAILLGEMADGAEQL